MGTSILEKFSEKKILSNYPALCFFANVVQFVVPDNLCRIFGFLQDLVFLFYLISFPVTAEIWSCIIAAKWKSGA